MDTQPGTNQLSISIIAKIQEILDGDGEIKKAEAEAILILTQALHITSNLPAQFATTQTAQESYRAIPANSVQPV